jgi:hypothetical protein
MINLNGKSIILISEFTWDETIDYMQNPLYHAYIKGYDKLGWGIRLTDCKLWIAEIKKIINVKDVFDTEKLCPQCFTLEDRMKITLLNNKTISTL